MGAAQVAGEVEVTEVIMRVRVTSFLGVAALAVGLGGTLGAQSGQYAKIGEIPIGGTVTGFDYLNVDSAARRLYVTNSTSVVVIDLVKGAVIGRLPAGTRVHGIAIAPGDRGFITNGSDNNVSIVDLKTLQPIGKVEAGANPDAILYEPRQKEIYAFNNTGHSATVINAATGAVVTTIPLSGVAETGQADIALGRVFVNIEDKSLVDVIDIATHKLIASWPIAPADTPTGMAIDLATHRIFVGGGPNTVMMDATSGKVLASFPINSGTDATWFDPGTKLVFSSCTGNGGTIVVAHVDGPDKLTVVQTIQTLRGARTMTLDPTTHNLYVVGQKYVPADPNAPPPAGGRGGRGGPPAIADSFHVEIFGMGK
jgi:DNA-binding beta-propeller fold protein YncE